MTLHRAVLLLHAADEDTGELQLGLYECGYKGHEQGQDGLGG